MSIPAVVMAAGLGTRLRPLTDTFAKPVLPIDGRPVIASLLRALAEAGCPRATVVTGHLAEQVEALVGDGRAFGLQVRFVRQPQPDGSADAVRRAGEEAPYVVTAADTLFAAGDPARFVAAFTSSGAAGAIGVRLHADKDPIGVEVGRVVRVHDPGGPGPFSGAPLWGVGPSVAARLAGVPGPPYELKDAFQGAVDAGEQVVAVELRPTRDLTGPVDLVEENFPYLRRI